VTCRLVVGSVQTSWVIRGCMVSLGRTGRAQARATPASSVNDKEDEDDSLPLPCVLYRMAQHPCVARRSGVVCVDNGDTKYHFKLQAPRCSTWHMDASANQQRESPLRA
jgi:hypothetical protein